jgi:hypothetical protein
VLTPEVEFRVGVFDLGVSLPLASGEIDIADFDVDVDAGGTGGDD